MHIAIDDTYGPKTAIRSRYVTGNRRTHLGVIFDDSHVEHIRQQISGCLEYASELTGVAVKEFHFVDIYNRSKNWANLKGDQNLRLFAAFADIYSRFRWPVEIQTIDDRTLNSEQWNNLKGKIDGLDVSKRSDLSLILLCMNIKKKYASRGEDLSLLIDQGKGRPGRQFGEKLFENWPAKFEGRYVSSEEPLMQIADFVAYCVNRSTILQMKEARTDIDAWFLDMVGNMGLNSSDLKRAVLPINFNIKEFDELHDKDRAIKGLTSLQ